METDIYREARPSIYVLVFSGKVYFLKVDLQHDAIVYLVTHLRLLFLFLKPIKDDKMFFACNPLLNSFINCNFYQN